MTMALRSLKNCQTCNKVMIKKMTRQATAAASEGRYRYIFQSNLGELGGFAMLMILVNWNAACVICR